MSEEWFESLQQIIDEYGVEILEDPDRLSQFLEDQALCGKETENFRFTFALHSIIRAGWAIGTDLRGVKRQSYINKLTSDLAFSNDEAENFLVTLEKLLKKDDTDENSDVLIARPGNLRTISGGIANSPRTMWLRKKTFYNGLILFAAFLAMVVLFFQIGKQRNPIGNEFRIAFLTPVSGIASQQGHNQLKAAQLAVERVNKQGGVRGLKLKLIGFDIPDNPKLAAEKAEKIMEDKSLLVMLTNLNSDSAKSLAQLSERLEIPLVLSSAEVTRDMMNNEDGKPYLYTFRLSNNGEEMARLMARYAIMALKAKRIALLWNENDQYSVESCEALRTWIKRYGRRISADISYSGDASDYTLALKTIKANRSDTLLLAGNTEHISELLVQAKTVDFQGNIIGANYGDSVEEDANKASFENSCWINRLTKRDPQILSVLKDYQKLYNESLPQEEVESAMLVYDSVRWIAAALYRAPGYRGEAVRHGLLSTRNLALTHATLTIDPRTHGPLDKAFALLRVSGNKGIFQRRISLKTDYNNNVK